MPLLKSWITSANTPETDFPLNNLPCGVFSLGDGNGNGDAHCGIAIGDMILDVTTAEEAGILTPSDTPVFDVPFWNDFMDLGPDIWAQFRAQLITLLSENSRQIPELEPHLLPQRHTMLHLPFAVSEFTDFYSSRHHAANVGAILRPTQNPLPSNWLHMPIGYNGRASSVVVSGAPIARPHGQIRSDPDTPPIFAPTRKFDFELELGAIVGQPSDGMISVNRADQMIFGYVLLNDWSARDIQAWENQPLGPFQSKATATSISPWIVTAAALRPFRTATPPRETPLLPHLRDTTPMLHDIALTATLTTHDGVQTTITRTNHNQLYYSPAQQLAHHTTSGCVMNTGDLIGSGTISGADETSRASLLELSHNGTRPLSLSNGQSRTFLLDGDSLTLSGAATGEGYKIGFGDCEGTISPPTDGPD